MVPFGRLGKDVHIARSPPEVISRTFFNLNLLGFGGMCGGLRCNFGYVVYSIALGTAVPSVVLELILQ